MAAFSNIGEEAPLPAQIDVVKLTEAQLLSRMSDLRMDEGIELREELLRTPNAAFSATDATLNAGIAMANALEVNETRAGVQQTYRDVLSALSPEAEAMVQALEARNNSAGRRL
jgi:hypothetical protein